MKMFLNLSLPHTHTHASLGLCMHQNGGQEWGACCDLATYGAHRLSSGHDQWNPCVGFTVLVALSSLPVSSRKIRINQSQPENNSHPQLLSFLFSSSMSSLVTPPPPPCHFNLLWRGSSMPRFPLATEWSNVAAQSVGCSSGLTSIWSRRFVVH